MTIYDIKRVLSEMKDDKEKRMSDFISINRDNVLVLFNNFSYHSSQIKFEKTSDNSILINGLLPIKNNSFKRGYPYKFVSPGNKIDVCFLGEYGYTIIRCSEMIMYSSTVFFSDAEYLGSLKTSFHKEFVSNYQDGDSFVTLNETAQENEDFILKLKEIHISDGFVPFSIGELKKKRCPCPNDFDKIEQLSYHEPEHQKTRLCVKFNQDISKFTPFNLKRFGLCVHSYEIHDRRRTIYNSTMDDVHTTEWSFYVSKKFEDYDDFLLFLANIIQNLSGTITDIRNNKILSDDYYIADGAYEIEFITPSLELEHNNPGWYGYNQAVLATVLGCTPTEKSTYKGSHREFSMY